MNNVKNIEYYLTQYKLNDPWDIVDYFEKKVSKYLGSQFGVAVDCCTHALFLCLKYLNSKEIISIPENTYISIPNVILMSGGKFKFIEKEWDGDYYLEPLNIIDSACKFTKNMYKKNSLTCLSFHHRKHIPIGRGGMILTDSEKTYKWLKKARYDGRNLNIKYDEDHFDSIGYHMYMTPEQACYGIEQMEKFIDNKISCGGSKKYKSLKVYENLFNK